MTALKLNGKAIDCDIGDIGEVDREAAARTLAFLVVNEAQRLRVDEVEVSRNQAQQAREHEKNDRKHLNCKWLTRAKVKSECGTKTFRAEVCTQKR